MIPLVEFATGFGATVTAAAAIGIYREARAFRSTVEGNEQRSKTNRRVLQREGYIREPAPAPYGTTDD